MQGHKLLPADIPSYLAINMQVYRILGGHCTNCPTKDKCFEKELVHQRGRRICRNIHWKVQAKTKLMEQTDEFKSVRGERQWKMEGVFAEAKDNHGLSRARYRGRAKMQIQSYMTAIVQNLKRIASNLILPLKTILENLIKLTEKLFFCENLAESFLQPIKS